MGNDISTAAQWVTATRDAYGVARVIAEGYSPKGWKKVNNSFRGSERSKILNALQMARGCCDDYTKPVIDSEGNSTAVQVWIGDEIPASSPPPMGVWRIDITDTELPPVITANTIGAKLLDSEYLVRSRRTFGVGDLFGLSTDLHHMLANLDSLYTEAKNSYQIYTLVREKQTPPHSFWPVELETLNYLTMPTTMGICAHAWVSPLENQTIQYHRAAIDLYAAILSDMPYEHGAICDIRFPRAPHVIRWLGKRPSYLDRGLSGGGALAIATEDHQLAVDSCARARSGLESQGQIRLRQTDGTHQLTKFSAIPISGKLAVVFITRLSDSTVI
ncbi:MAG: hypothetical protein ACRCSF_03580 [Mycobacteriaceae bacterium]